MHKNLTCCQGNCDVFLYSLLICVLCGVIESVIMVDSEQTATDDDRTSTVCQVRTSPVSDDFVNCSAHTTSSGATSHSTDDAVKVSDCLSVCDVKSIVHLSETLTALRLTCDISRSVEPVEQFDSVTMTA